MKRSAGRRALPACVLPVCGFAADPPAIDTKPGFNLRDVAVREILLKAAEAPRAFEPRTKRLDDGDIPASTAALKMAPYFARPRSPATPQESTCTPVASGGPRGTEMQHVGIASDPLQRWVATQAGYIEGSVGGGSWPCSTRDAGMPSPWVK